MGLNNHISGQETDAMATAGIYLLNYLEIDMDNITEEQTKPELSEVLEIDTLKKQASEIYEQIEEKVKAIAEKYGDGRFDYELDEAADGKPYMKLEITDTVKELMENGKVFRSASVPLWSFKTMALKGKPKSL